MSVLEEWQANQIVIAVSNAAFAQERAAEYAQMSNWKGGARFTSLSPMSISMEVNGALFTVLIFRAEWQGLAKLPRLLL